MRIAFLHTADVHVETFERLFVGADVDLVHHVDAALLDKARCDGVGAVRIDVLDLLSQLSRSADAVLCTCSTLGPLADEAAETAANVLRIDRPVMEQACADGSEILVALCLDSTRAATLDLLHSCAAAQGQRINPKVVMCDGAWAYFEAGDMDGYAATISNAIKDQIGQQSDVHSIVLAQASMRVAESRLVHFGVPVRSSPEIAAQRCLEIARKARS